MSFPANIAAQTRSGKFMICSTPSRGYVRWGGPSCFSTKSWLFAVLAPQWNWLPTDIRNAESLHNVRRDWKLICSNFILAHENTTLKKQIVSKLWHLKQFSYLMNCMYSNESCNFWVASSRLSALNVRCLDKSVRWINVMKYNISRQNHSRWTEMPSAVTVSVFSAGLTLFYLPALVH